jgi:hypothetical protein
VSIYFASAVLPDGRAQVWEIQFTPTSSFRTRWKLTTDPNSQWSGWSDFNGTGLPSQNLQDVTAGSLSDGRPQLWAVDGINNQIYTSWKLSTDPKSLWNNWIPFPTPGTPAGSQFFSVAVVPLPDKRLQLFITDFNDVVWTAWKTTTAANSAWSNFSKFE